MPWGDEIKFTEKKYYWIKSNSQGSPNLNKALNIAYDIAKEHIAQYSKCFPPIVYNVSTINQAISLHEQESVYKIKGLKNEIGNVLFANVNVINKDEKPSIENSNYEFNRKLASYFVNDLYTTKIGFYTSSADLKMLDIRMNLFNEMVLVLNQGSYLMDDKIVQQMKNLKQEYE